MDVVVVDVDDIWAARVRMDSRSAFVGSAGGAPPLTGS